MERMRTLAFQVPGQPVSACESLSGTEPHDAEAIRHRLIESEIEQDEAQYQASHPEEQEDKEESDDQAEDEEMEEEIQDEFAPQEPRKAPAANWRNNPQPRRTPPPWTVLRSVLKKFPRRMTGPRKPGRKKPGKNPPARRTLRTRKSRKITPTPCLCNFVLVLPWYN